MATFHLLCGLGRSFMPKQTLLSRVITRPIHSTARTSKAKFASSWSSPSFFGSCLAPIRVTGVPNQSSVVKFIQSTPWKATHTQRRSPFRGQGRPPKGSWLDNLPQGTIFWGILVANVGVFAAWAYAENSIKVLRDTRPYIWMLQNFTSSVDNVASGRVWTILTSCFSQSSTTHLLFNGFTYFFMARPVLSMLGNKQFLVLYLGGGLVSSITSMIWNSDRKHSSQGASGAIYSIMTYFACCHPRTSFMLFAVIPIPAWAFVPGILAYDIYDMISTNRMTKTDTAGHIGGVLGGAAYFLARRAGRF